MKKAFFDKGFFPVGVYGANLNNLEQIKRLAVNTVVLRGTGANLEEQVEKCHTVGLRYMLTTPREPGTLPGYLDEIAGYVRPHDMAFYVNDEPGIHSFSSGKAVDVNRLIKDRFPMCATAMAVVRPQVCREYADGADFFLLDQYPVPFMPVGWLSDSMDCCAEGLACGGAEGEDGRGLGRRAGWRIRWGSFGGGDSGVRGAATLGSSEDADLAGDGLSSVLVGGAWGQGDFFLYLFVDWKDGRRQGAAGACGWAVESGVSLAGG